VSQYTQSEIETRRAIEDELLALGVERERMIRDDSWNRERTRRLVGPAREAGIKVRDIARMTGLSTQTLHTWMLDLMRPIPDIHLGLAGPSPETLEKSVLRTMGEEAPAHEWTPESLRARIPSDWPTGTVEEIEITLERMVRWHMIWDGRDGYRVAPPTETGV
jgi:hypothetical protein